MKKIAVVTGVAMIAVAGVVLFQNSNLTGQLTSYMTSNSNISGVPESAVACSPRGNCVGGYIGACNPATCSQKINTGFCTAGGEQCLTMNAPCQNLNLCTLEIGDTLPSPYTTAEQCSECFTKYFECIQGEGPDSCLNISSSRSYEGCMEGCRGTLDFCLRTTPNSQVCEGMISTTAGTSSSARAAPTNAPTTSASESEAMMPW